MEAMELSSFRADTNEHGSAQHETPSYPTHDIELCDDRDDALTLHMGTQPSPPH